MSVNNEKIKYEIEKLFTSKRQRYHSLSFSELSGLIDAEIERKSLKKICRNLEEEGIIIIDNDRILNPSHYNIVAGTIKIVRTGEGRVYPEKEPRKAIFVDFDKTGDALDGDFVYVRVAKIGRRGRPYGEVVKVLRRKQKRIIGEIKKVGRKLIAVPISRSNLPDIIIDGKEAKPLKQGDIVIVEPSAKKKDLWHINGRLIDVIGDKNSSAIGTKIVIEKNGFADEFSSNVLKEAKSLSSDIRKEIERRVDFRNLKTVTVDGEKARDFDDAVSIEKIEKNLFRLYVHIADVSYYVKENSLIDKEAWKRATSVYFPDYWIPMLPMKLSSDLCSLNQGKDRLTVSVVMDIDKKGEIIDYRIVESVIRSDERMTYTNFQKVLDGSDEQIIQRYSNYAEDFKLMEELCHILKEKRRRRGSLDFDLPEPEFILDATGDIIDIVKSERLTSHRIIEEFMIAANETVAEYLFKHSEPSIYRVHELPDKDSIDEFNEFIKGLDFDLKPIGKIAPKNFQKMLDSVQGLEIEHLVSTVLLRTMKHALYTTKTEGHFGLASKHYTHFTSPIRRYPDLVVHRILKRMLNRKKKESYSNDYLKQLEKTAAHSSEMERKAEDAEREVLNRKKLEFLKAHTGEVFDGIISGVAEFGFFVEIEGYYVDGLVRMKSLKGDYFIFEADKHRIRGRRSGITFRIGDRVRVLVIDVYPERGEMDLELLYDRFDGFISLNKKRRKKRSRRISKRRN